MKRFETRGQRESRKREVGCRSMEGGANEDEDTLKVTKEAGINTPTS